MKMITLLKSLPGLAKVCLGSKVPLRVSQCITYRCNLNCNYCSRNTRTESELPTGQVMDIMRSFRKRGALYWSLNGGEPLMRDDIGKLVDHARDLGMYLTIATNGTMVKSRIEEIKRADLVNISIDGTREIQDQMRSGSFERIIEGLDALAGKSIATTFTTVIGKHSCHSTDSVLDLAEEYHARVFFQPVRVQKEDIQGKSMAYFPSKNEMEEALEHIIAEKRKGRPVASSVKYLELMKRCWPDTMPDVKCWAGRIYCFITPEGYVTACCDTMASARETPECDIKIHGAGAFQNIPRFNCATCYSSIPSEVNLMMNTLFRNPLELIGQLMSFFIRR